MKYDKVAVAHAMPLTYAASVPAQPILGDDLDSTIPPNSGPGWCA